MPAGHLCLSARMAVVVALALAGCGSTQPPRDARATGISSSAPEPFFEMRNVLVRLGRLRDGGDAAGARALYPDVLREAKQLFQMGPPHDLKKENIARFLDARTGFAGAVNSLSRAAAATDDAAFWLASRDLDASFWAWFDAYRGKPSEGAV